MLRKRHIARAASVIEACLLQSLATMSGSTHDDFDAWAKLSARLRTLDADGQAAELDALGAAAADWAHVDRYWRAMLIEDIARDEMTRPLRYQQLCKAAVASHTRSLEDIEPETRVANKPSILPTSASLPTRIAERGGLVPAAHKELGDFRGDVMEDFPNLEHTIRSEPSSTPNEGSFVERLSPHPVTPPSDDQTSTSGVTSAAVDAAKAASDALDWTLAQYAEVCAQIARDPSNAERIWSEHGVAAKYIERVTSRWQTRIAEDPALASQWREMMSAVK